MPDGVNKVANQSKVARMGRARPSPVEGNTQARRNLPNMMQFDGEAREKRDRTQRNLGALRREGFQPARRHPSAARHRYHQHAYTDDELDEDGKVPTLKTPFTYTVCLIFLGSGGWPRELFTDKLRLLLCCRVFVYVCMYVCMYICIYICMYG